jgi:hypothetical protein
MKSRLNRSAFILPCPSRPRWLATGFAGCCYLLARQPIDIERPHPFTLDGETDFNCLLWMPPAGERAGDIVLVDSTHFTTLFGGTDSLKAFWRNLSLMK